MKDCSVLGMTPRPSWTSASAEDDGDAISMLSNLLNRGLGLGVLCNGVVKASSTCSCAVRRSPTFGVFRTEGDGTTKRFAGVTRLGSGTSSKLSREAIAVGLGVWAEATWRRPDCGFGLDFVAVGGAGARKRCGDGVCDGIVLLASSH